MRVIIEYVMHSTRRLIILKVTSVSVMLESLGKSYFAYMGKACEKNVLMLLAMISILHFTTMLEHVSVCFEIVICHYLTQWNKIIKLPKTHNFKEECWKSSTQVNC